MTGDGEGGAASGGRGTLAALAELRMRLLWRRLRGRGGTLELVARVTAFAIVLPAAAVLAVLAGTGTFHAVRAGRGLRADVPVSALFFGVWQAWTALSLSLAEGEALDLRRYLVYPIPPGRVWTYGLVASVVGDPFALFWCVLLAGAFAGAAFARPGAWLVPFALVLLAFVAATVALVALVQELLARLVRGNRVRAIAIAAVYVGAALAATWASGATRASGLHALREARSLQWIAWPGALAARAARRLFAAEVAAALPWLAALAGAAAATGWAAFRLALGAARSGGEGRRGPARAGGAGWPTGALPGRVGPLLEKELKYFARHPLTPILALVLPAFAAGVAWKLSPRIPAEAGEVVRALPLFGFALYAHLVTQVFWLNAFGWDRGGARLWFLAPVPARDLVVAKNAAAYAVAVALFGGAAAAMIAVGGAPPAWAIAGALVLHAAVAPWMYGAANLVSILNPRAATMTLQRRAGLPQLSGLAGMAILSATAGLFAAPVLLALRLDEPWALPPAWGLLGAAGLAAYRAALPRVAALLERRREALLEEVAGDEG